MEAMDIRAPPVIHDAAAALEPGPLLNREENVEERRCDTGQVTRLWGRDLGVIDTFWVNTSGENLQKLDYIHDNLNILIFLLQKHELYKCTLLIYFMHFE